MNQPRVPQLPNHDGKPQDGRTYQYGDPGAFIGTLLSVTSTFGIEQFPRCSFLGTEGAAWYRHDGVYQIVRFLDAPFSLELPVSIDSVAEKSINAWTFLDGAYREVFRTTDRVFGRAAESQHARFWVPRLFEQMEKQPPLKLWCAPPRYLALTKDSVEVQQAMRRDVVTPKEITVSFNDTDLVLHADAFFEARFLAEETPNTMVMLMLLRRLGATAK
jgi:hypothetical protein